MRKRSEDGERRFTQLYQDNSHDILAFLLRRCATTEDAADCLAETFEVAWAKRDRIPTGSQARPWLFVVARNVMRRSHEREGRRNATARELASALEALRDNAISPADDHSDPADDLLAALAELSALDQEILTLIAWDGLTPTEVAMTLHLSPNVVRVRAHRARAKLRERFAGQHTTSEATPSGHHADQTDISSPERITAC